MSRVSIWQTLGIRQTRDRNEIRRAYARKLKETNPEDNPDGFKALRWAYEQALARSSVPGQVIAPAPVSDLAEMTALNETLSVEPSAIGGEAAPENTPPLRLLEADGTEEPVVHAPPSPDPRIAHGVAQERLSRLLSRKTTDVEILHAAFQAVVNSPAMAIIDVEVTTEDWLADFLARHTPHSDRLIGPAIDRFGWANGASLQHRHGPVAQLIRRVDDLKFLRTITQPDGLHSGAYKILSRPFSPISLRWRFLSPATPAMVSDLLRLVRNHYPGVLDYFDAETVAHWEAWLSARPRLPTWGLWMTAATPICLVIILICRLLPTDLWAAISIVLSFPPVLALAAWIVTLGPEVPKRLWRKNRFELSGLMEFGWAPATLGLLAVAALPAQAWITMIVGIGASVVALWAGTSGRLDKAKQGWLPWQARALLGEGYVLAWWIVSSFYLPSDTAIQISLAIVAAAFVSAWGRLPAYMAWLRLRRIWHTVLPVCGLIAAIGAAYLLWLSLDAPALRGPAACAIAAVVFVQRPLTSTMGSLSFRLRLFTLFGMMRLGMGDGAPKIFAAGGCALLFWAAVVLVLTLVGEIGGAKSRV